jgi:hypothetical protein
MIAIVSASNICVTPTSKPFRNRSLPKWGQYDTFSCAMRPPSFSTTLIRGDVGPLASRSRAFGADVYATASAGKHDVVRGCGATPIDSRTAKVADYVARHAYGVGFNVVYDTVSRQTPDDSLVPPTLQSRAQLLRVQQTRSGSRLVVRCAVSWSM